MQVHYKLELLEETLFLNVNIIDRFLALENVVRKKLQLVGVTAMLLACKYEEVSVPVVEDLILICDRAYTRADILEMVKMVNIFIFCAKDKKIREMTLKFMQERWIVNTLKFNMSVPTPYCFMRRFLKAAQAEKKVRYRYILLFVVDGSCNKLYLCCISTCTLTKKNYILLDSSSSYHSS